jgi:uncharacterized membrane protein YhaH (DUF805 family)
MEVSDLWRSDGTISRTNYVLWGVSLFGIKYGIDSFVAGVIFHRAWSFFSYLFPGQSMDLLALSNADRVFFATIMVIALPFVWAGVVLTMRRLRAVGMPVFLVYLFFVPFVNILLFVLLSVMPTIAKTKVSVTEPAPATPPALTEADSSQLPAVTGDAPAVIPPLPNWPKPDRSLPQHQQLARRRIKRRTSCKQWWQWCRRRLRLRGWESFGFNPMVGGCSSDCRLQSA